MKLAKYAFARVSLLSAVILFGCAALAEDWPCWRGPRGDGTSLEKNVPLHWGPESNIVWQTELPGNGHSSPVIRGEKLFLTAALSNAQDRVLMGLDTTSGKVFWQESVLQAPLEKKHYLNSFASSTPAADTDRVYVAFLDRDQMFVAAYSFDGKRKWAVRPGTFASMHGFCSSPVLYRDKVLVNGDHDGDSYLVALSREDGKVLWKTPRQNHTRSYCAPLVRELSGRAQMVLSGDKCIASYNPDSGQQYWVIDGPTEQFVASPVHHKTSGLVFITGGFPDHHILAIRPDGNGNISQSHIAWRTTEGAAYVPSPIIEGDYFLVISDAGVAHCFEAETGKLAWKKRFGEQHASLVSAEGRVYFLNDKGEMNVVQVGPEFSQAALNRIGEKCFASPAISNGRIYLRGDRHLFCIGEK